MLADPVIFRGNARSAHHQHAHRVGPAGDDGIGVQGGAQIKGGYRSGILIGKDEMQHLADRFQQIVMVGGGLGSGNQSGSVDEDGIGVGAADIDSYTHGNSLPE